jgi:hypothetical protein
MKSFDYAKKELVAGRYPEILIDGAAGSFWLCTRDWSPLKGVHYPSRDAAILDRSKVIDRASKSHWKETS